MILEATKHSRISPSRRVRRRLLRLLLLLLLDNRASLHLGHIPEATADVGNSWASPPLRNGILAREMREAAIGTRM
jgi:hypothetical protein